MTTAGPGLSWKPFPGPLPLSAAPPSGVRGLTETRVGQEGVFRGPVNGLPSPGSQPFIFHFLSIYGK